MRRHRPVPPAADLLAYAVAGGFALVSTLPILWLLLTSLRPEDEIVSAAVRYLPDRLTLAHYRAVWWQSNFLSLLANSAATAVIVVATCVVAGTPAAYALSRNGQRHGRELLVALLVVRMAPPVLLLVPIYLLLRAYGLLDTSLGLALAHTSLLLPLFVWLAKGAFDAVPLDLDDAARIDGCTRIGALCRVVLPLAAPGTLAATAFVAIESWNEFLYALMLTSGAGARTWPVGLQLMIGEFQLPWGMLSAGGILSIAPVAVLFAFVHRRLVAGIGGALHEREDDRAR